ncbi:phosphatidylinositol-specific phospholipase c, X domain-containing protein [Ditylenchus destructor]|uniref:Phosphoinositide phospholipase C n=1 Tax=Ditylenchus destructor TaxID=166010 RepID=A0AAD4N7S3_9BILA|nr:phosphatidylinositol-specific phospholipase c, X domain-containing protein [Ditylenchus destructor]
MAQPSLDDAIRLLQEGISVRRVKRSKLTQPSSIVMDEHQILSYSGQRTGFCSALGKNIKRMNVSELLEVRQGYNSDGLHKASKHYKFQESRCFSIIFKHPSFVCKSIDFVAKDEQSLSTWINALRQVMAHASKNTMSFNEKLWISNNFRRADLNRNGEIEFDELWKLLKKLNLQLSLPYVQILFKETIQKKNPPSQSLNEDEFFHLFERLTDLPEYRNALRLANPESEEFLDVPTIHRFLTEEQGFKPLDNKKIEAIVELCETRDTTQNKVLTANGFRRLLQSRWGNILREDHESVFMDMNQPLPHYFINASHNTYLTGLQVRGNATVEGYISALRKGARLLELDIFDGENGEPSITHKRTFISSISLRNALKCIGQYAFQINPYPVILTLENHVGLVQQRVMTDIFKEVNILATKPLPSPHQLKNKILLRGKTSAILAAISPAIADNVKDEDDPDSPEEKTSPRSPIDPTFGKLIALPSVKLSTSFYKDLQEHPFNGSPSLAEGKVLTCLESNSPIFSYTATRIIKSYPRGIRQDSSNMNPVPSWICGIQAVAMNMQTASEEMDLVKGLFGVNGNIGYVLKPKVLLDGIDPRHKRVEAEMEFQLAIICGQYLPKPEPGKDIIDPYVSVEIFGVPSDERKARTRAVRNNGFNPVWNENFSFHLHCPELALVRFAIKDFDSTSANDFIGEYSVPVSNIRQGYSHVRLNTGFEHTPDDAASIFIRVAFEKP